MKMNNIILGIIGGMVGVAIVKITDEIAFKKKFKRDLYNIKDITKVEWEHRMNDIKNP